METERGNLLKNQNQKCNRLEDKILSIEIKNGGSNLSVGQKQIICIARAIIKKPKILLMDEATANIDTYTDALIQKLVRDEFEDTTVITIAHRIETIITYDRLIIMKNGEIVETGSPRELIEDQDSHFTNMIKGAGENYIMRLFEEINKIRQID